MRQCAELGIVFLSTPYSMSDIDFLDGLGVPGFKIASGQAVEPPFLEHAASKRRPVILSTGMCTLEEVGRAVGIFRKAGAEGLAVLQCTSDYPARTSDANILAMSAMGEALDVIVGYSDHTTTPFAALAAVARGAKVIEKHFTIDKSLPGPDQKASADFEELRWLVASIRELESALGSDQKKPSPSELRNLIAARRSIAARTDIPEGAVITHDMLTLMRPATGLEPARWQSVVGKKAGRTIGKGTLLSWEHLNG
jgi:sialic acid synthase SpsE